MNGTIIMVKGNPPSWVCFSLDDLNQENDDRSKLTGPYYGDDLSQEDDFGAKLATDPFYYRTLDGSHHSRAENQGQLDLKLKIARQQEKLDMLSSKLSQCEVENEALKAEKAVLVDELALSVQEQPSQDKGGFPKEPMTMTGRCNCLSIQTQSLWWIMPAYKSLLTSREGPSNPTLRIANEAVTMTSKR